MASHECITHQAREKFLANLDLAKGMMPGLLEKVREITGDSYEGSQQEAFERNLSRTLDNIIRHFDEQTTYEPKTKGGFPELFRGQTAQLGHQVNEASVIQAIAQHTGSVPSPIQKQLITAIVQCSFFKAIQEPAENVHCDEIKARLDDEVAAAKGGPRKQRDWTTVMREDPTGVTGAARY